MGLSLGIFLRVQTEKQGNMDKVSSAIGEMSGGVVCCYGCNEDSKGGSLILMGRGVLVCNVPEHAGEVLIDISLVQPCRIVQVSESLQKVGLGDIPPCRCTQV